MRRTETKRDKLTAANKTRPRWIKSIQIYHLYRSANQKTVSITRIRIVETRS
jgi:hypothetical protein